MSVTTANLSAPVTAEPNRWIADLLGDFGMVAGAVPTLDIVANTATLSPFSCFDDQGEIFLKTGEVLDMDPGTVGPGGLDQGALAVNTWYAYWAIADVVRRRVSTLMSTSFTDPVMPAGYNRKRRLSCIRTNSAGNFRDIRLVESPNARKRIYSWEWNNGAPNSYNGVLPVHPTYDTMDHSASVPPTCDRILECTVRMRLPLASFCFLEFRPEAAAFSTPTNLYVFPPNAAETPLTCSLAIVNQTSQVSRQADADVTLTLKPLVFVDNL